MFKQVPQRFFAFAFQEVALFVSEISVFLYVDFLPKTLGLRSS